MTEDQKKKVSADTVKKLEDAEKALAIVSKYSKEWVKGKWYDKKGSQTYTGIGKWKKDSKGWKFYTDAKTVLKNQWKKINGNWYYFKADGYIAMKEFVKGWRLNKAGAWKDPVRCSWHKSGSKWWYGTKDGWYAKGKSYTIDGKKYTFDKKGYTK